MTHENGTGVTDRPRRRDRVFNQHVGSMVNFLRREVGMSIDELAARSHIEFERLDEIEYEECEPTIEDIINIADVLGVTVAHFYRQRLLGI